jgi:short subunit dehydrogenase-like uncharacterized protein
MTSKPVIVYGASGYTGRLICEYLREYNVPFTAAGRDKARIAEALDKVPGIDTIEHDIVEVSPSTAARSSRPASTPAATTWTPPGSRTG